MKPENPFDSVWEKSPNLIKGYLNLLPKHEKLCEEIEYILKTTLKKSGIEIAHITRRAKEINSFCEKIYRKNYENPLVDITDLAGVRVVFLYKTDHHEIEKIIENEFEVIEKQNKLDNSNAERFGYGAFHYLVKIKGNHIGARYDDLRSLVCEIQVRTILQDAWGIVAHHLSYKNETDVPQTLIRKLNALSGLFETADDQFENLRTARNNYIEDTKKNISINPIDSLNHPLNLDNLFAYATTKFPDREASDIEGYAELLKELKEVGYETLGQLDADINKGLDFALKEEKEDPPYSASLEFTTYAALGIIRTTIAIMNEDYCERKYNDNVIFKKYNSFS